MGAWEKASTGYSSSSSEKFLLHNDTNISCFIIALNIEYFIMTLVIVVVFLKWNV